MQCSCSGTNRNLSDSFFILLTALPCVTSPCKTFEMFVLTLVINISLGNSARMSPSDGTSTLSGMPSSLSLASVLSVGHRYLHSGLSYCCHDHFGNILWFMTWTIEECDCPPETSYQIYIWNDGDLQFSSALQMPA